MIVFVGTTSGNLFYGQIACILKLITYCKEHDIPFPDPNVIMGSSGGILSLSICASVLWDEDALLATLANLSSDKFFKQDSQQLPIINYLMNGSCLERNNEANLEELLPTLSAFENKQIIVGTYRSDFGHHYPYIYTNNELYFT